MRQVWLILFVLEKFKIAHVFRSICIDMTFSILWMGHYGNHPELRRISTRVIAFSILTWKYSFLGIAVDGLLDYLGCLHNRGVSLVDRPVLVKITRHFLPACAWHLSSKNNIRQATLSTDSWPVGRMPLYAELKLAAILWLCLPQTRGALFIWTKYKKEIDLVFGQLVEQLNKFQGQATELAKEHFNKAQEKITEKIAEVKAVYFVFLFFLAFSVSCVSCHASKVSFHEGTHCTSILSSSSSTKVCIRQWLDRSLGCGYNLQLIFVFFFSQPAAAKPAKAD